MHLFESHYASPYWLSKCLKQSFDLKNKWGYLTLLFLILWFLNTDKKVEYTSSSRILLTSLSVFRNGGWIPLSSVWTSFSTLSYCERKSRLKLAKFGCNLPPIPTYLLNNHFSWIFLVNLWSFLVKLWIFLEQYKKSCLPKAEQAEPWVVFKLYHSTYIRQLL